MATRSIPKSVAHARARVASLTRSRTPDDPELVEARRQLRAAGLEEHIAKVIAGAPPLTAEQRDKLALLLRAGAPPGRPAALASGGTTSAETGTEARPGGAA